MKQNNIKGALLGTMLLLCAFACTEKEVIKPNETPTPQSPVVEPSGSPYEGLLVGRWKLTMVGDRPWFDYYPCTMEFTATCGYIDSMIYHGTELEDTSAYHGTWSFVGDDSVSIVLDDGSLGGFVIVSLDSTTLQRRYWLDEAPPYITAGYYYDTYQRLP